MWYLVYITAESSIWRYRRVFRVWLPIRYRPAGRQQIHLQCCTMVYIRINVCLLLKLQEQIHLADLKSLTSKLEWEPLYPHVELEGLSIYCIVGVQEPIPIA